MKINGFDFKKDIFLLDSNAFMTESFRFFLKNELILAINEYREKGGSNYCVHIPKTVKEELEKLSEQKGSDALHKRTEARKGIDTLTSLVTKGYGKIAKVDFTGVVNGFNDVAVLTMLMELRRYSNVSVLTNDRDFATDLLNLNLLKSVKSSKKVRVFYVNNAKNPKLKAWELHKGLREAERFPNEKG